MPIETPHDISSERVYKTKREDMIFMKERSIVRTSLSVATALVISFSTLTIASADNSVTAAPVTETVSVCEIHHYGPGRITTAATLTSEGIRTFTCTECGAEKTTVVPKLTDIKDAEITNVSAKYTCNGKPQHPLPTVTYNNKELIPGRDYIIIYGANTKPGTGSVTIKGIGTFGGSLTRKFTIAPARGGLGKVTSSKAAIATVKVKAVAGADGYRIAYSTNKSFKKSTVKYVNVKKNNLTATIKKLKGGKVYYFKVQAYKTVGGKKVYGKYSTVKKTKIKQTTSQVRAAKIKRVVDYGIANAGGSYVYCGASFRATDCSGLTMQCFAKAGISLPHNAAAQASYGKAVSYKDMQAGDLIICCGYGHAALYIGNGKFVHASNPAKGITIEPVSQLQYYGIDTIRRLI